MISSLRIDKSLVLLAPLFIGCASIHKGNFAKNEKGEIAIQEGLSTSGIENTRYSSPHFLPLEFTIENNTNDWIVIESINFSFKNIPPEEVSLPTGEDLASWSQASTQLASIRQKNSALIAGSLLMIAGGASQSRSSTRLNTGSLALLGTGAGLTLAALSRNERNIDVSRSLPPDHILSGVFTVPPGLFVKKWAVFYVKNPMALPYMDEINLVMKVRNKSSVSFNLPFRTSLGSEFQSGHPNGHRKKEM